MAEISMNGLESRLEYFKRQDEERSRFFKAIVEENEDLKLKLAVKTSDHEDQLASRRMWQQRATLAESNLKESQDTAAVNCYIVVLIDGDGYYFDEDLVSKGAAGGREAAKRLIENIRRHAQAYEGGRQWKIIVRVYANLEGLARKYLDIGFLDDESALRQFSSGFTQNQPLFDFVDAGSGKERADHKIKENLGLYINNMQCKHILLGVAHDNGYVPALDPYRNDAELVSQITLLRPPNPGREYQNLPFKFVVFESVFRSEELPATPAIGKPTYANLAKTPAIPLQKIKAPPSPVNTAKVIATRGLPSNRPLYPGPILLNEDEERLDEPFDEPSAKAWANLEQRLQSGKHCNDFHLRGECWNTKCQYLHGTPLRADELIAFALRARQTPCNLGSGCRSRTCVLGHVCRNAPYCTRGVTCYFKRLHHVNPQFHHELED